MPSMRFFFLLAIVCIVTSCGNPEKKLQSLAEKYAAGDASTAEKIPGAFINAVSEVWFSSDGLTSNERILYYRSDTNMSVVYPEKKKLVMDNIDSSSFEYENGVFAENSGRFLMINDLNRNAKKEIEFENDKTPIRSVLIAGDTVIYYSGARLYSVDLASGKKDSYLKNDFPAPYPKYYSVKMTRSEKKICLLAGSAGSYNLSVIDTDSKSAPIKNTPASSSKLHLQGKYLYYIAGGTGAWELVKMDTSARTKAVVTKFNDLSDIELYGGCCLFENTRGLWSCNYEGKKIIIPFGYQLFGKVNGKALLKYGSRVYLADAGQVFEKAVKLKEKAPGLFSE